ncbi:MAG: hypothetical protein JEZ14_22655 [Marinilabiliaceae bacterium]|nr:hypothetical protein [Marinilabiliaceae bacterium]
MIRKCLLERYQLYYDEKYVYASDYDFIAKISRYADVINLSEVLLRYRTHVKQISFQYFNKQKEYADSIRLSQLKNFNIIPDDSEKELHLSLMDGQKIKDQTKFNKMLRWGEKLLDANEKMRFYDSQALAFLLQQQLKYKIRLDI